MGEIYQINKKPVETVPQTVKRSALIDKRNPP